MRTSVFHDDSSGRGNRGVLKHRLWHQAEPKQSFFARMQVAQAGSTTLLCRYSADHAWSVETDILVDGVLIAHQGPWKEPPLCPDMIEVGYAIPDNLLLGKREIQIGFHSNGRPPRVFEIRTIRP